MKEIISLLRNLFNEKNLDNYFIMSGVIYKVVEDEPDINAYFDSEGNIDYEELFRVTGEYICLISDIKQVWHSNKTIVIITKDCKIIINSSGYSITSV